MYRTDRRAQILSCWQLSVCILFLCLLCLWPGLTVQAEDRPANRRGTENQPDDRRETEIYLVSIGQTEVSAWVEAPDKPGDREPEENDQSEEDSPEETSDQMQSGGEEIKTADQNAVTVFIVLLLLSGMVIIVEGIRIVKYGK